MTTTKRDNPTVAHLWANQSRPEWRSASGNFSFRGPVLRSYSTPIAVIRPGGCILITSRTFSMTTSSKHMPAMWWAIGYRTDNVFRVPVVDPTNDQGHRENERHYRETLGAELRRATKTAHKVNRPIHMERAQALHAEWSAYCVMFSRAAPAAWDVPETVMASIHAAAVAEQAAHQAERAERERLEAIRTAAVRAQWEAEMAEWIAGSLTARPRMWNRFDPIRLRVSPRDPETLETSWGAAVPLSLAVQAFKIADKCRATGREWVATPTQGLRLGDYKLDCIKPDGTIIAGCHVIEWSEAHRLATALGVLAVV